MAAATPLPAGWARGAWLLLGLGGAVNLAALAMPLYAMEVFNRVLPTGNLVTLAWLLAAYALVATMQAVLDHLRGGALGALGGRWLDGATGPLLRAGGAAGPRGGQEAVRDLDTLRAVLAAPAATAPLDFAWTPLFLAALLWLHPLFAALAAGGAVALAVLNLAGALLARPGLLAANAAAAAAFAEAAGTIRAAEAVTAMGLLPALRRHRGGARRTMLAEAHRAQRLAKTLAIAARVLRLVLAAATVALGAVLALRGLADAGTILAANLLVARALLPFEQAGAAWRLWSEGLAAWRRVRAALAAAPAAPAGLVLRPPVGRLVAERVAFLPRGAERAVLRGVSFVLEPGTVTVLTGPSGAGKSALVRLVLGAEAPSAGTLRLDGYPTHLWDRGDLARHVGHVPQHLGLVDGTVAQNVSRFALAPNPARLLGACREAGVHAAVARLPEGYSTRIGPGGFALSAGQRQALALARALYGDPCLLVLDEPDAHLDAEGEATLLAVLGRLRGRGVGVLVVTHRPALAAAADRRLVLEAGLLVPEAAARPAAAPARPRPALAEGGA